MRLWFHDVMTSADAVRFLRTEPAMAYPDGRLLAIRDGGLHALAPDGWIAIGRTLPVGAAPMTREEAEDWCESAGWDLHLLDEVPGD